MGEHKKYHVKAWGHPSRPDLDLVCDEEPAELGEYPYRSVRLQMPITRAQIEAVLADDAK